jgi:hypothetical protein
MHADVHSIAMSFGYVVFVDSVGGNFAFDAASKKVIQPENRDA